MSANYKSNKPVLALEGESLDDLRRVLEYLIDQEEQHYEEGIASGHFEPSSFIHIYERAVRLAQLLPHA